MRPVRLEAHAAQEVGRHDARCPTGPGLRVSPNASTAEIPPRFTRSRAIPCTSIRPSPPPAWSGCTHTVLSRTASGETGAVGNAAAPGRNAGGRVDRVAHRPLVDERHPAARAPLPEHVGDPGLLLRGRLARRRPGCGSPGRAARTGRSCTGPTGPRRAGRGGPASGARPCGTSDLLLPVTPCDAPGGAFSVHRAGPSSTLEAPWTSPRAHRTAASTPTSSATPRARRG